MLAIIEQTEDLCRHYRYLKSSEEIQDDNDPLAIGVGGFGIAAAEHGSSATLKNMGAVTQAGACDG